MGRECGESLLVGIISVRSELAFISGTRGGWREGGGFTGAQVVQWTEFSDKLEVELLNGEG